MRQWLWRSPFEQRLQFSLRSRNGVSCFRADPPGCCLRLASCTGSGSADPACSRDSSPPRIRRGVNWAVLANVLGVASRQTPSAATGRYGRPNRVLGVSSITPDLGLRSRGDALTV